MLTTLAISGYRSLRDVIVPLGALTVVAGPNGSGKSNLYRALRLLSAAGKGDMIGAVAREGGIPSVLWAGPEKPTGAAQAQGAVRKGPISVSLGFASDQLGYLVDLGLPQVDPSTTRFARDPEIKREQIFTGGFARPSTVLVDRLRDGVRINDSGWHGVAQPMHAFESILTGLGDGDAAPELLSVRRMLASWRFYDHFRVDGDAPARSPQVGTRAHLLAHDGANLASVWATIDEAGGRDRLDAAVDDAFPGSRVEIDEIDGRFRLAMRHPGLLRSLDTAELSDGTLRYLLLCAALLTPRPASLIVLNEPEASLHPDLLPAVARLVRRASEHAQILVVTHANTLARSLDAPLTHRLQSTASGTEIEDQGTLDRPGWHWPGR